MKGRIENFILGFTIVIPVAILVFFLDGLRGVWEIFAVFSIGVFLILLHSFIYKSFYNNNRWTDWVYRILLMPALAYALWWLGCFIIFGLINEFENHGFQLFLFAISLILILYLWYVTNTAVNDRKRDDKLAEIDDAKFN